jgi:hypothetical protein
MVTGCKGRKHDFFEDCGREAINIPVLPELLLELLRLYPILRDT